MSNDSFRKPSRRKFTFGDLMFLQRIRVTFVYEGHQVKVKVTGAKCRQCVFPQCKTSIGHNSASIKHRATKLACSLGFSAMTDGMV